MCAAVSYNGVVYKLQITKNASRDLRKLPSNLAIKIVDKMQDVASDPFAQNNNIKVLSGGEGCRLRVGSYRAVYYIHDEALVLELVKVKHRKEVYK